MTERELLFSIRRDDFDLEFFRAGGKGGQKQNKTETGVRIRHRESGAVAESRTARTQNENRKLAWQRLQETPKWTLWFKKKVADAVLTADQRQRRDTAIEEAVERQMRPEYLVMEVQDEHGRWVPVEDVVDDG